MDNLNSIRIISSLRGMVNDQFYSMIRFCLTLPLGGKKLAEKMLRNLAILHSQSSLNSEAFKTTHGPLPRELSPAGALRYIFELHAQEKVIDRQWAQVTQENGSIIVSYDRDKCVYNTHCHALVCDGLECICVRRFFCEGIIKTMCGKDYESSLTTPDLDQPMCRFTLTQAANRDEQALKDIGELEASAAENARLLEAVEMKTRLLERQKDIILERESQLAAITTSAADAIIMVDPAGTAIFWNPAAEKMFGYAADEIIGQDVVPLLAPPQKRDAFKQELGRMEVSMAHPPAALKFENEGMKKGGALFDMEVSISILMMDGKPYALGAVRDVTERKKAESALKQLVKETAHVTGEDFFQTIVRNLSRLLNVRYAFISRISSADTRTLETVTFCQGDELLPNFKYDFQGTPCEKVVMERRYVSYSSAVAKLFPEDVWLAQNNIDSYAAIPIINSRGIMLGHMGVMNDHPFESSELNISIMKTFADRVCAEIERARAEQERLKLSEKMLQTQKLESLGVLAGGIAHDFNNIFTAVLGDCDLALAELAPGTPIHGKIMEIKKATKHASDLSHQMLAYSGRGKFNITDVNLNIIISEMANLLARPASKNVEIIYHLEDPLPLITGDVPQLRQVLLNLVTNASEAIGEGPGRITIGTGVMECHEGCFKTMYLKEDLPAGLYVYFEVADSGSGMDKNTLDNIFDPFFTTKLTGRGLGLSAVLGIIRGHRGAIKIDSEPGAGATFRILFPVAAHPQPTLSIKSKPSAGSDVMTGTILIIDDEEIVRDVASKLLGLMGLKTLTASDGVHGLEMFEAHMDDIGLVLLDLTMPRMDGLECLKRLKALKSNVRVIIASGYDEQEVSGLFSGQGATGFIQKPFDLEMIRSAVTKAMRE
ncbi:MAG: PAS domain S-box protein [Nitrospinota bacterium]|nr:PAS domain S-box protein [Nitrospinota bacterium]